MSPSLYALGAAVALGVLTALGVLVTPRRARSTVGGLGTAACGAAGIAAGVLATVGPTGTATLPWLLPLAGVRLELDGLGAPFVGLVGAVAVAAGVHAVAYTRHELAARTVQALLPLFVVAMLLVPAAGGVATFLACWELMAVTSLVLVVAEHRRGASVASAGRWYAVMTHLGFVAVLTGLLVLLAHAGDDSFAALRTAGRALSPASAGLVFVLVLVGFAAKAGIVPLHAWLPRAHPEAPAPVSALMSAAMVALGVYGLVRVALDLLGGGVTWWWLLVLTLGALSAAYGILHAAMSTDLKALLGWSTTENMGLVLIGVGTAGLLATAGARTLAGLALVAALLHVLGHGAYKSALFLGAGSVVHATGTRDLDALGGLRTRMPVTTTVVGIGALAASALPPGTAFASEWLLLQALVHGLPAGGTVTTVAMPLAVAVVALTAGLAVATFVKAFGVGFLARPRSAAAADAHEVSPAMLVGAGLAALAAVVLAVVPTVVLPALDGATAVALGPGTPAVAGAVTMTLVGVAGALSPLLLAAALVAAVLLVGGLRRLAAPAREARIWDCGGGPTSPRTEYTATSFAEPLQRVFDDVLDPEVAVEVSHHDDAGRLVRGVAFRRRVPDRVERALYRPVLAAVAAWGLAGRRLATGSVHRYLGYGFYAVCALLIVVAVVR